MIYRVGDGNNPAYDYSSQLKPAGNAEGQEKFSLEHQKEQASPKKDEKGEDKKLHEKSGAEIKRQQGGVKLEISGRQDTDREQSQKTAAASETSSIISLGQLLRSAWRAVKDFLYLLWNDPPVEVISQDVTPEEAERYTEEYYARKGIPREEVVSEKMMPASKAAETVSEEESYAADQARRDEKIRRHLRSGNLEQVISLLTDDGRRAVAKNSTLLTYYDKSGKLTQLSASDKERILHGDRHARTL